MVRPFFIQVMEIFLSAYLDFGTLLLYEFEGYGYPVLQKKALLPLSFPDVSKTLTSFMSAFSCCNKVADSAGMNGSDRTANRQDKFTQRLTTVAARSWNQVVHLDWLGLYRKSPVCSLDAKFLPTTL
jgi:hypothetical protein